MDGKREAGPPAKRARTQGSGENDEFSKLYKAMDDYEPTVRECVAHWRRLAVKGLVATPTQALTASLFAFLFSQIPDDIVSYYLERSGFATDDVRMCVLRRRCTARTIARWR